MRRSFLVLLLGVWLLLSLPALARAEQIVPFGTLGTFEYRMTTNGILVAAPHGTTDTNTAVVAGLVAKRLGSGYVLARGFNPRVSILTPWRTSRINVNRPTEGGENLSCDHGRETDRARLIFGEYWRLVTVASGNAPLRLYIELHANDRRESSGNVEVATRGITHAEAQRVKSAYPRIGGLIKAQWPSYPSLQLLIEPADRPYWRVGCTNACLWCTQLPGIILHPAIDRALHFEFAETALRDERLFPASAFLAAGVVEQVVGR